MQRGGSLRHDGRPISEAGGLPGEIESAGGGAVVVDQGGSTAGGKRVRLQRQHHQTCPRMGCNGGGESGRALDHVHKALPITVSMPLTLPEKSGALAAFFRSVGATVPMLTPCGQPHLGWFLTYRGIDSTRQSLLRVETPLLLATSLEASRLLICT